MARARNIKNPFTTLAAPSPLLNFLSLSPFTSLLFSPKRSSCSRKPQTLSVVPAIPILLISLIFSIFVLGILIIEAIPTSHNSLACSLISPSSSYPYPSRLLLSSVMNPPGDDTPRLSGSQMVPLPIHVPAGNLTEDEKEFWRQPDGEGYRPCLDFSIEYRKKSARVSKENKKFLVVVVSGGLNQQRNQIIDAVVIARILEASLVVPILQVNKIWGDESEFSDVFDVEHFKRTLQADVRVVSSLPSTHLMSRQTIENRIPHDIPPLWIRARFLKQLNEEGVLVLKGLDSKLAKNLQPDLQKLRCKVAFHALRFASPVQELGNQLARRMWIEGPYIALHLRLETDVWVRTGCQTGLGNKYDKEIAEIRRFHPEYLTGKSNLDHTQRRLAGLCPLNAFEMTRLLKALGAPRTARIYIAGGKPFGGRKALESLTAEFPNLMTKEALARPRELSRHVNRSSVLAAIDYIVSLNSDVFIPSHGGNMGRAMQGHRAYIGHRKYIKPNKRAFISLLEDSSSVSDREVESVVRSMHSKSQGQAKARDKKRDRDVVAYPVPECMCKQPTTRALFRL